MIQSAIRQFAKSATGDMGSLPKALGVLQIMYRCQLFSILLLVAVNGCGNSPTGPELLKPPGEITMVTELSPTETGFVRDLAVGGGHIAWWEDSFNGNGGVSPFSRLTVVDVITGRKWIPVTERFPGVTVLTENHVYWTSTDSVTGVRSLYRSRLSEVSDPAVEVLEPEITCPLAATDQFVSWCAETGTLVVLDLETGVTKRLGDPRIEGSIASSGTYLGWVESKAGSQYLVVLDVETGEKQHLVPWSPGADVWDAGLAGTRLVWVQHFPGAGTYNIIAKNIFSGREVFRQQIDHAVTLALSNRWVAWIDDTGDVRQIQVHRWATDTLEVISPQNRPHDSDAYSFGNLRSSGSKLVWTEGLWNEGKLQIWLFRGEH